MNRSSFRNDGSARGAGPKGRSAPRCSILVVEGYVDLAEAVKGVLKEEGYTVTVAADGRAALEAVETFSPEVVLLDLDLPDITCLEVAARLREHRNAGRARFVAITAWEELVQRSRAGRHGFAAYVLKPFDVRAILEAVEQARRG